MDLAEKVRAVVNGSWTVFSIWCGLATLAADRFFEMQMFWLGFVILICSAFLAMGEHADLERALPPNA